MASETLITRRFGVLVGAHLLQALGYSSMLLLPLYLQHLGASRASIGAIMATAAVSGLIARPGVGWALDNIGRKPTLIVGTVLLGLGMGLIAAVDRVGWVVYLHRVIVGLGLGALFTGYFTFAADLIPASRRTEGLALFGISGLLPLLVNPLADQLQLEPADLRWFLPVIGAISMVSLIGLALLPEPAVDRARRLPWRQVARYLLAKPLWPSWFATSVFSGMVSLFFAFATVTAEKRGVARPSTLWLSYALGAVCVRLFGARLPDRIGPSNLVSPALGCYATAALVVAEASSLEGFLLAGGLAGVGHGYCFPVLSGQVVSRAPERVRGSALAAFTALWGVSQLVVSPAFGAVADRYDDAAMFLLAAVTSSAALAPWLWLEHRFARSSLDGAAT